MEPVGFLEVLHQGDPREFQELPGGRMVRRARPLRAVLAQQGYVATVPVYDLPGFDSVTVSLEHLRGEDPDETVVILGYQYNDPSLVGKHDPDADIPPHDHRGDGLA